MTEEQRQKITEETKRQVTARIVNNLKNSGMTTVEVAQVTGLSIQEINRLPHTVPTIDDPDDPKPTIDDELAQLFEQVRSFKQLPTSLWDLWYQWLVAKVRETPMTIEERGYFESGLVKTAGEMEIEHERREEEGAHIKRATMEAITRVERETDDIVARAKQETAELVKRLEEELTSKVRRAILENTVRRHKRIGFDMEQIVEMTGLSPEEIEAL